MTPEEIQDEVTRLEDRIEEIIEAVMEMQVSLSPEPQTEPGDYFHETVSEIHKYESYLSDLIVEVNRDKARAEMWVRGKKHDIDLAYSDALVDNPVIAKKKSVADRKAAALQVVRQETQDLLLLQKIQGDFAQLNRSLVRKAEELKSKGTALRQQQKVWETEWQMTHVYQTGMGGSKKKVSPFAPPHNHDQSPTAEDLDLGEAIAASKNKSHNFELDEEGVEELPEEGVEEIGEDILASVQPLSSREIAEELPVEAQDVRAPQVFISPTPSEEDLDALLESSLGKTSSEEVITESEDLESILAGGELGVEEIPVESNALPSESVGEDQDLDSLLNLGE